MCERTDSERLVFDVHHDEREPDLRVFVDSSRRERHDIVINPTGTCSVVSDYRTAIDL